MNRAIPMSGRKFGCLIVLEEAKSSTPRSKAWVAQCQKCGAIKEVLGGNLRRLVKTMAEGCQCEGHPSRIHGLWNHPAYDTWEGMMARCYKPSHIAFHRYGGRGIVVCPEWHNPAVFIPWLVGHGWEKGLQLDRVDNDKGYAPENCRVVAPIVNANNREDCRNLNLQGMVVTISEASRMFGIRKTTIKERLNRGWSDLDAVKPVGVRP